MHSNTHETNVMSKLGHRSCDVFQSIEADKFQCVVFIVVKNGSVMIIFLCNSWVLGMVHVWWIATCFHLFREVREANQFAFGFDQVIHSSCLVKHETRFWKVGFYFIEGHALQKLSIQGFPQIWDRWWGEPAQLGTRAEGKLGNTGSRLNPVLKHVQSEKVHWGDAQQVQKLAAFQRKSASEDPSDLWTFGCLMLFDAIWTSLGVHFFRRAWATCPFGRFLDADQFSPSSCKARKQKE